MNRTEKNAFREALIIVLMGAVIYFPLQTILIWLTIYNCHMSNPLMISLFVQAILTLVALVRVFSIRMRFQRGKF